ncbi:MAG: ABC transporter ATP-binding protein [Burkholderiales bacterium]
MIKVENLCKSFGAKIAVNDVSFTVERGEVLGFLGPNGAGKSTTMRMITGYYPPTSGKVTVGGFDIMEKPIEAKRLIGYLPENAPGYADMTVRGFLSFAAELRGLHGDARRKAVHHAVEMCSLENVLHQTIDTLSKGYKHRTCLAQSLVHDPEVLIMDEPTDGLDPNQKHEVRLLIRRMAATKAIIFSTHILEEVEETCSRAIIIDRGTIVANGTPAELKSRSDMAGAVHVQTSGVAGAALLEHMNRVSGVVRAEVIAEANGRVEARAYPDKRNRNLNLTRAIAELAAQQHWQLDEIHTETGKLDEVFRAITLPDTVHTATATTKAA